MSDTSVLNKLQDVYIANKEMTGDDGKPVKYKRLMLVVEFDGVVEEVEAQISRAEGRSGYRLLALADDVK